MSQIYNPNGRESALLTPSKIKCFLSLLALAIILAQASSSRPPSKSKGAQVWRIYIDDSVDHNKLQQLKKQLSGEEFGQTKRHLDRIFRLSEIKQAKKVLEASKLKYKVLVRDLKKSIKAADTKQPPKLKLMRLDDVDRIYQRVEDIIPIVHSQNITFQDYHSLKDIHGYLDHLSRTYDKCVSAEVIGKTFEGRDLKLLNISCGPPGAPFFWIDGGIHAREWISPATVLYIIRELVERRDTLPAAMRNVNFLILPVANPDGYEFTRLADKKEMRLWRKNRNAENGFCIGVDINRNFDVGWGQAGSSRDPCSVTYSGRVPNSEKETQHIIDIISRNVPQIKAFVTFHSYSQVILYPWGYTFASHPNQTELHRVGEEAARRIKKLKGTKYTVSSIAEWRNELLSGNSIDWGATKRIPYVYGMELRDEGKFRFELPPSQIIPTGKEGFEFINTVAEALVNL